MRTPSRAEIAIADRSVLVQEAFKIEYLTIAWMLIEASVAVAAGIIAGSLALTSFGFDSVIELVSATLVLRRLRAELTGTLADEHAERQLHGDIRSSQHQRCSTPSGAENENTRFRHVEPRIPSILPVVDIREQGEPTLLNHRSKALDGRFERSCARNGAYVIGYWH